MELGILAALSKGSDNRGAARIAFEKTPHSHYLAGVRQRVSDGILLWHINLLCESFGKRVHGRGFVGKPFTRSDGAAECPSLSLAGPSTFSSIQNRGDATAGPIAADHGGCENDGRKDDHAVEPPRQSPRSGERADQDDCGEHQAAGGREDRRLRERTANLADRGRRGKPSLVKAPLEPNSQQPAGGQQ